MTFENDAPRTSNERYYLPNVEIKDYNVVTDEKKVFDQSIKKNEITCQNIRKITSGQGYYYTTSCLVDYAYFKGYHKMIAIDLSKQQALDDNPRAIQQINLTANLDIAGNTRIYFILEKVQEIVLDFSQENLNVL